MNKPGRMACVLLLMMLVACEKKVGGQVIALIDDEEITQQELNAEFGRHKLPANFDRKMLSAQLLKRIIDRKLLVIEAKREHLNRSSEYLNLVAAARDAILIDMLAKKVSRTIPLPNNHTVNKFEEKNSLIFNGRKSYKVYQLIPDENFVPSLAENLSRANDVSSAKAILNSARISFQSRENIVDTANLNLTDAARIAAILPGKPLLLKNSGQDTVNFVQAVENVHVSTDQARPVILEVLRRQAVERMLRKKIDDARAVAQITYAHEYAAFGQDPSFVRE